MNDRSRSLTDWLLMAGFCGFLFFFGLDYLGLIGADEPRYAQIAREMLARHDWVTPVLGGRPWLEKPPLYYWQAILAYSLLGVTDWAARIPSAVDATLLVVAVYFFLRRFRPGFQLDGALMVASTAGVIGFARAASTDMPLTATFTVALLAWYAWRESEKRFYLAGFYAFLALATLAKGPVALLLAVLIIVVFAAAGRDYRLAVRTLWVPGIALYGAVALPWYVAVQLRNPEFFRVFILQHNLARFGTDLYHHQQPLWYFLPVTVLALLPWTVFVIAALAAAIRSWWSEGRATFRSEEALDVFLMIWLVVPAVFFSLSQSKLPGYILPAIPAGAMLLAEYVRRHVMEEVRSPRLVIVLHAVTAALVMIPALMIQYIVIQHRLPWGTATMVSVIVTAVLAVGMTLTLDSRLGLRMLRFVTLVPVVLALAAVLKIGQMGGPKLDEALSARPLAADIARVEGGNLTTAVFRVPREAEYGLAFYRNQVIQNYDRGEIPSRDHLLVTAEGLQPEAAKLLGGRRISFLGNFAAQHLEYYWVSAAGMQGMEHHH